MTGGWGRHLRRVRRHTVFWPAGTHVQRSAAPKLTGRRSSLAPGTWRTTSRTPSVEWLSTTRRRVPPGDIATTAGRVCSRNALPFQFTITTVAPVRNGRIASRNLIIARIASWRIGGPAGTGRSGGRFTDSMPPTTPLLEHPERSLHLCLTIRPRPLRTSRAQALPYRLSHAWLREVAALSLRASGALQRTPRPRCQSEGSARDAQVRQTGSIPSLSAPPKDEESTAHFRILKGPAELETSKSKCSRHHDAAPSRPPAAASVGRQSMLTHRLCHPGSVIDHCPEGARWRDLCDACWQPGLTDNRKTVCHAGQL